VVIFVSTVSVFSVFHYLQCFKISMYDDEVVLFVNDCTYDILLTKSFYARLFIILPVLSCIVLTFSISDGCISVDRQKLNELTSYKTETER
jgi:hypothetical protein